MPELCNGFAIKVKNNLPDDLLAIQIHLNGADIQPTGIQKLNAKSETVLTVNNSAEDRPMSGEFIFRTISLPSNEVKIKFDLSNKVLICEHTDNTLSGHYSVEKTRLPGKVTYTIGN